MITCLSGFELKNDGILLGTYPDADHGVYMFVDDMNETREDPNLEENGLKTINASGNWNFEINQDEFYLYNNNVPYLFQFERGEENVFGGISPWLKSFYNIPDDPAVEDLRSDARISREIVNGNDEFLIRDAGGFNSEFNSYAGPPSFKVDDVIDINSNPMILNYPKKFITNITEPGQFPHNIITSQPYYLNGLSINLIEEDQTSGINSDDYKKIKIRVRFDEVTVTKNAIWTGATIILPDITEDNNSDLIIDEEKTITLDRSEMINSQDVFIATKSQYIIQPTTLVISSDSKLHLKESAVLRITGNSKLVIEDGAEVLLEDKACILVEPDGILEIKGNNIHLNGKDAVIILKGELITEDGVDFTFKGTGYTDFHSTHILSMGAGSNFVLQRLSGTPGYQDRFIRIRDNTTVYIKDRTIDLMGGIVYYDNDAKLRAENSAVVFNETIFSDLDDDLTTSNFNSIGLDGVNLTSCYVEDCTFEYFDKGVLLTGNTIVPYFENNDFNGSFQGLVADKMNEIFLVDNDFMDNITDGVNLEDIDVARFTRNRIERSDNGCNFKNVNFAYLQGTHIADCNDNGVLAEKTNVFLNNSGEILDNDIGVHFVNNPDGIYMLSVGKCYCVNP